MVWKLAERLRSWLDGLQASQTSWKLYNLTEQTAHGPNDLLKYTSKQDPTDVSAKRMLTSISAGVGWVSPVRLTSKAKTNM